VQDNDHGLTIQVNPLVKGLFLCLVLNPMVLCYYRYLGVSDNAIPPRRA
jgi:hypothetical protein